MSTLNRAHSRDHAGIISILSDRKNGSRQRQRQQKYAESPSLSSISEPGSSSPDEGLQSRRKRRMASRSHSMKTDFRCMEDDVIRCISANIVSVIQQSENDSYIPPNKYRIFCRECTPEAIHPDSYSLEAVQFIFTIIHHESEMEYECMIIALIYMERLSKVTNNDFRICALNWRYTLFTCMLLASKIWDDFSMVNVDFAGMFSNTSLTHLNQMESAILRMLNFSMMITCEEYMRLHNTIQDLITIAHSKKTLEKFELSGFDDVLSSDANSDCSACRKVSLEDWSEDGREGIPLRTGGISSANYMTTITPRLVRAASEEMASNGVRRKPFSTGPSIFSSQCKERTKHPPPTPAPTQSDYRAKSSLRRRLGKALSALSKRLLPRTQGRPSSSSSDGGKIYVETSVRSDATLSLRAAAGQSSPSVPRRQEFNVASLYSQSSI
eukprot:CAMPEP_0185036254 /NCGR_PEP_ID=MMETSP1103-20130426/28947_1 /TAXON_ID=36769 /ORGANISM="Paraphysomonas bandaiensis, Strain Caron Lab Isolate" /LENGTH=439 /DNA_ID=CAMNT_0027573733 /DNA_START=90 /DNA_END=1409 /DNA_ORIENTATION=-